MRRLVLFAFLVAALLATLAWAATDHLRAPVHGTAKAESARRPRGLPTPPSAAARTAARRFLTAFLAYEVGGAGALTAAAIRANASPSFARELLGAPPRRGHAEAAPARLVSLRLVRLPGRQGLLLASGTAARPGGAEPFAFLFARRRGRWLAAAPAE